MSDMTREEAIEEIKRWTPILLTSGQCTEKTSKAQDMAISALSEELSEDGTLTVHVSDGSKVNRVLVMGENIFGGLYYPDSAENKGEWVPITKWTPANDPPKETGRYLVYIVNEYDEELQYIMTADYIARPTPIEGLSPWNVDDECASDNVVAWMPLPEGYKQEGDE